MSSWNSVGDWYDRLVGEKGHYYHEEVILPHLKELFRGSKTVLDVGCGQGILGKILSDEVSYFGIDNAPSLIERAKQLRRGQFFVMDAATFSLEKRDFDAAALLLSLQDMEKGEEVIKRIYFHLRKGGRLVIVLNHPCFRIPRQSSWEVDISKKMQSRLLHLYMTPLEIPILTKPSQKETSPKVKFYHNPLSVYSRWLFEAGFSIKKIEEWVSNKVSVGQVARMENRARKEFPLFLCIVCEK